MRPFFIFLGMIWSLPTTLLGLFVGFLCLITRGKVQRKGRVLEFYGGFVTWSLSKMRISPLAMTLGHVIIGRDAEALDLCREHEMVHVCQCERWGPFFLPAYLGYSALIWFKKGDIYRDNPFEVEAYAISDPFNPKVPEEEQEQIA